MPMYEYVCEHCPGRLEINVPIEDRDSQKCDTCNSDLVRLFTFQGSVYAPTSTGGNKR